MRVVNPMGRKIDTSVEANNIVRGCTCGTWSNYSGTRTTSDSCSHCGCNCRDASGETTKYSTNNYKDASTAGRKSPVAY